jgi:hypothetical protein
MVEEELPMIPKITQIDTEQVSRHLMLNLAGSKDSAAEVPAAPTPALTPPLVLKTRPELRKALLASWTRNEAAYRYLGR